MDSINFIKMHGLGNDFVIIDNRSRDFAFSPIIISNIADRRRGIGCDQLIILEKSDKADVYMRIFNPDGGEVGACGNATRCVGWLIAKEMNRVEINIETKMGVLHSVLQENGEVSVDMGLPRLLWQEIPLNKDIAQGKGTKEQEIDTKRIEFDFSAIDASIPKWFSAVNMGNPHGVFFVDNCEQISLEKIGKDIENHPIFPERANISFASLIGENHFRVRVWERGAGITLACGTAACAVGVAATRLEKAKGDIIIQLPGGNLSIKIDKKGHVIMTGPVATSFVGVIDSSIVDAHLIASKCQYNGKTI